MQGRYITERRAVHVLFYRPFLRVSSYGQVWLRYQLKRPDFHEGKSTASKCNKTIVDYITQILVEYHIHTAYYQSTNSVELHKLLHRRISKIKGSIHPEQLGDNIAKTRA